MQGLCLMLSQGSCPLDNCPKLSEKLQTPAHYTQFNKSQNVVFVCLKQFQTGKHLIIYWCALRALKSEPEQTFFMIFETGMFLRGFRVQELGLWKLDLKNKLVRKQTQMYIICCTCRCPRALCARESAMDASKSM